MIVLLEADCGDLVALAIADAQQREYADVRRDVPVLTCDDVERVGAALRILGGIVEEVRRP